MSCNRYYKNIKKEKFMLISKWNFIFSDSNCEYFISYSNLKIIVTYIYVQFNWWKKKTILYYKSRKDWYTIIQIWILIYLNTGHYIFLFFLNFRLKYYEFYSNQSIYLLNTSSRGFTSKDVLICHIISIIIVQNKNA